MAMRPFAAMVRLADSVGYEADSVTGQELEGTGEEDLPHLTAESIETQEVMGSLGLHVQGHTRAILCYYIIVFKSILAPHL